MKKYALVFCMFWLFSCGDADKKVTTLSISGVDQLSSDGTTKISDATSKMIFLVESTSGEVTVFPKSCISNPVECKNTTQPCKRNPSCGYDKTDPSKTFSLVEPLIVSQDITVYACMMNVSDEVVGSGKQVVSPANVNSSPVEITIGAPTPSVNPSQNEHCTNLLRSIPLG